MKATLKNTSLMSLAKPIFESIVNTIGSQCWDESGLHWGITTADITLYEWKTSTR
jgi:hypothetical protein